MKEEYKDAKYKITIFYNGQEDRRHAMRNTIDEVHEWLADGENLPVFKSSYKWVVIDSNGEKVMSGTAIKQVIIKQDD